MRARYASTSEDVILLLRIALCAIVPREATQETSFVPAILLALALFLFGPVIAIWATDRLLAGLVGLARLPALSTFAIGAALSGFEAENVAVGLAAALGGGAPIALGTVFGGATFLVGVALGLGALFYPMRVRLPRGFLVVLAL